MSFVNNYQPEGPVLDLLGPEPYDANFVFPVPTALSSDRVRLVPFVPRTHASAHCEGTRGHESTYRYIPAALEHASEFLESVEVFRRDKGTVLLAIIDTTRPDSNHPEWGGSIAGMIGLLDTDENHLITEIGPVVVLPAFRRTHVASHTVGLMLKYTLELPPNGLGLRRVKWRA
ncbi:hypothetical protein ID866_3399 [Astraeus odoratus]|nr:hypothetical protein ID866_3399 [Astraeus odoratus]